MTSHWWEVRLCRRKREGKSHFLLMEGGIDGDLTITGGNKLPKKQKTNKHTERCGSSTTLAADVTVKSTRLNKSLFPHMCMYIYIYERNIYRFWQSRVHYSWYLSATEHRIHALYVRMIKLKDSLSRQTDCWRSARDRHADSVVICVRDHLLFSFSSRKHFKQTQRGI